MTMKPALLNRVSLDRLLLQRSAYQRDAAKVRAFRSGVRYAANNMTYAEMCTTRDLDYGELPSRMVELNPHLADPELRERFGAGILAVLAEVDAAAVNPFTTTGNQA